MDTLLTVPDEQLTLDLFPEALGMATFKAKTLGYPVVVVENRRGVKAHGEEVAASYALAYSEQRTLATVEPNGSVRYASQGVRS